MEGRKIDDLIPIYLYTKILKKWCTKVTGVHFTVEGFALWQNCSSFYVNEQFRLDLEEVLLHATKASNLLRFIQTIKLFNTIFFHFSLARIEQALALGECTHKTKYREHRQKIFTRRKRRRKSKFCAFSNYRDRYLARTRTQVGNIDVVQHSPIPDPSSAFSTR